MDLDGGVVDVTSWPGPDDPELRDASVDALMEPVRKELRSLKRKLVGIVVIKAAFYGSVWVAAIKFLVGA